MKEIPRTASIQDLNLPYCHDPSNDIIVIAYELICCERAKHNHNIYFKQLLQIIITDTKVSQINLKSINTSNEAVMLILHDSLFFHPQQLTERDTGN